MHRNIRRCYSLTALPRASRIGDVSMATVGTTRDEPARSQSSLRLVEILQIRRRLILPGGHEGAVRALEIAFATNENVLVVLGAMILDPDRVTVACVAPGHRPRARQGVVERRELVAQD